MYRENLEFYFQFSFPSTRYYAFNPRLFIPISDDRKNSLGDILKHLAHPSLTLLPPMTPIDAMFFGSMVKVGGGEVQFLGVDCWL